MLSVIFLVVGSIVIEYSDGAADDPLPIAATAGARLGTTALRVWKGVETNSNAPE